MIIVEWVTRAQCQCGAFLWTNPGSGSVVCSCHIGEIVNHSIKVGLPVGDERAFLVAVAEDLGVETEEVVLTQATGP
jgi:soluble P-type ATPase